MKPVEFEHFKNELIKKYVIDCWIFLEDLEHSSSSTFYKILAPFLRASYNDNYRFILCNNTPLQTSTLDHVVDTINYLDISPYFIEIYTNQSATADYFCSLPDPISTTQLNIKRNASQLDGTPLFNTDRKMCAHAWTGVHIWPDGSVGVCCDYKDLIVDVDNVPYNINSQSVSEILSSQYMDNLRSQMRQGQDPIACSKCVDIESKGGKSKRMLAPYRLQNIWGLIDWESNDISNLGYLGGHLGNLCNLKCRICSPAFSSTVASEELSNLSNDEIKLHPTYKISNAANWTKKNNALWEWLKDMPQIKNFEFLGGEPFMLKQNLDFMQYLVDNQLSEECIFDFVSNGTIYPEIFDRADKFKRLVVTLSIDNIDKRFEYERSGAKWSVLQNNVEKFLNVKLKNPSLKIGVAIAVNIQNVLYLPELLSWIKQHSFDHYHFNIVTSPKWISITQLTKSAQQLVLDKLLACELESEDDHNLQYIIQSVRNSSGSDGKDFVAHMRAKDQIRNENFATTHKEIAVAMGYYET